MVVLMRHFMDKEYSSSKWLELQTNEYIKILFFLHIHKYYKVYFINQAQRNTNEIHSYKNIPEQNYKLRVIYLLNSLFCIFRWVG